MQGNEAYLRIKLRNARLEAVRLEDKLSHLRIDLGHLVDQHAIRQTEIASLEAMLEDMYGTE